MLNQKEELDLNIFLNLDQYLDLASNESTKNELKDHLIEWTKEAFSQGKTIEKLNFCLALEEEGLALDKLKGKENIGVFQDHFVLLVEKDAHDGIEKNIEKFVTEVSKEVKELYTFH